MGGRGSKHVHVHNDNSAINANISALNGQIEKLKNDMEKLKGNIDNYVEDVEEYCKDFETNLMTTRNEIHEFTNTLNSNIKTIKSNLTLLTISYEQTHVTIEQNNINNERYMLSLSKQNKVLRDFQKILYLKIELENEIKNNKIQQLEIHIKNLYNNRQLCDVVNNNMIILDETTNQFDKVIELDNLIGQFNDKFKQINLNSTITYDYPLDNTISDITFANKLYDFGIRTQSEICESVLNNCGFDDVIEIKYQMLLNKFVQGCKKLSLKLDWKLEDPYIFCNTVFTTSKYKSLNCMYETFVNNNCIYQKCDEENKNEICSLFWTCCVETKKILDLQYEDPIIIYEIFVHCNIDNLNNIEITLKNIGYGDVTWIVCNKIIGWLKQLDNEKYKIFKYYVNIDTENIIKERLCNETNEFVNLFKHILKNILSSIEIKAHNSNDIILFIKEVIIKFLPEYEHITKNANTYIDSLNITICPTYDNEKIVPILCIDEKQFKNLLELIKLNIVDYYWKKMKL